MLVHLEIEEGGPLFIGELEPLASPSYEWHHIRLT